MRKAAIASLSVATLIVAGGYYGLADALDILPGPFTLASAAYELQPFPQISAQTPQASLPAGLSTSAPVPQAETLDAYVQALASDPLIGAATTGVSVIDVLSGKTLVDHDAATALTPASSNKVLMAWAAMSALGAEHRVETSAVLSGSTLTLVGGGDVLLAADAGDPDAVVGHAGLGDLARAAAKKLQAQGVSEVNLALDDTLFSSQTWNNKWEDGNEAWVAPIQPIMIDVSAYEDTGAYPADPALDAAEAFRTALSNAGIAVSGEVTRASAPAHAQTLASVSSATLAQVLAVTLKASDNTLAEVQGHILAAATGYEASFTGAAQAVLAQLKTDGFDTSGVSIYDCSGLAKADKVPPQLLAQIMARAAGDAGAGAGRSLLTALPISGLDGTLSQRFTDTQTSGVIRAKTGSLDQSASLSGIVVDKDGRLLAFSVIVDGFDAGALYSARVAIDQDFASPLATYTAAS